MQKNNTYNVYKKINQSMETDSEITQMAELADKDTKTVTINPFHMLKKAKESMKMLKRT